MIRRDKYLVVPAGKLQPLGAPAQVRAHDHNLAIMDVAVAKGRMLLQQHSVVAHDAMNPFGVTAGLSREPSFGNKIGREIRLWISSPLSFGA